MFNFESAKQPAIDVMLKDSKNKNTNKLLNYNYDRKAETVDVVRLTRCFHIKNDFIHRRQSSLCILKHFSYDTGYEKVESIV